MNEKRILVYLLILIFLIFSVMGYMMIEAHIQRTQISLLLEFEKFLGRVYIDYVSGNDIRDQMVSTIPGFGFYNYYGEPLFLHGTAEDVVKASSSIPYFNNDRKSIILQRDILNPFIPMLGNQELLDVLNSDYKNKIDAQSDEYRNQMVRYVYIEIQDERIYNIIDRFRILQYIMPLFPILLILFIWHIYNRNISYRKQIEEQERLVVLGTAARTLTHEIKNPLSSIRLQSTIIKRSGCSLHDPSLNIINEEVQRLSHLTEKVGDFLRSPEGNPVVCHLKKEVSQILTRYSMPIQFSPPDEDLCILIDPDRFRSVIENLLNNALQSGSDVEKIRVSLEHLGHNVNINIKDNGKGIPKKNREHLFDPFFTTKSTGSGIGLSVVSSFVSAAKGEINIESEENQGTTVTLTFPSAESTE